MAAASSGYSPIWFGLRRTPTDSVTSTSAIETLDGRSRTPLGQFKNSIETGRRYTRRIIIVFLPYSFTFFQPSSDSSRVFVSLWLFSLKSCWWQRKASSAFYDSPLVGFVTLSDISTDTRVSSLPFAPAPLHARIFSISLSLSDSFSLSRCPSVRLL